MPCLGLSQLSCGTDRLRVPLQVEDHSGNDPQLVPGSLYPCFWMFPERFRSASVSVGSREARLFSTEHQKCGSLSCWSPGSVVKWLPSISSETCVIFSSLVVGTDVFRDCPFLGYTSVIKKSDSLLREKFRTVYFRANKILINRK